MKLQPNWLNYLLKIHINHYNYTSWHSHSEVAEYSSSYETKEASNSNTWPGLLSSK